MWKKLLPLAAVAVAVLLAGVVIVDLVRENTGGGGFGERAALLSAMDAKLRGTGTTTITFSGNLRPQVGAGNITWTGTSKVKWADEPLTDTEFTEIKPSSFRAVQARRIFDGTASYYRSPVFVPSDKRPWINNRKTGMFWADMLADPELHLPDYTMWQGFIRTIPEDNAAGAPTEELTDVADAPNEYNLTCAAGEDPGCPPPFPTPLDQFFNGAPITTWSIWLGDDGLPRRIDIRSVLLWDPNKKANPDDIGAPYPEYEFTGSFQFSGYGEPVTIEAPPAGEVTRDQVVNAQK